MYKRLTAILVASLVTSAILASTVMAPAFARMQSPVTAAPRETLKEALEAFNSGDYDRTLAIADHSPDADTLALAARTLNAVAYLTEGDKPARIASKRAYKYALRALEFDENFVEAHIQAAISDAIRAGRISPMRAFMKGLAGRSRKSIDRALALDPDNPWALSTSGAWHLEVQRAGGGRIYGARPQQGYRQLMRARALKPDNIPIAYETSLRLLAANNAHWRNDALTALRTALTSTEIEGVHEQEIRRRAALFDTAIKQGPAAEAAYIKAQD